MQGILIVDKPKNFTSHDIVDLIRKKFNIKKVGHAGTLDPSATGVLVVLIGKATKSSAQLSGQDKEYQACLTLGIATDSLDSEGNITKREKVGSISQDRLQKIFNQFKGRIEQVPPMFSALRHRGRKLYDLARRGIEVKRKARIVYIHQLKLIKRSTTQIHFSIKCSKGTYIRTLAADIAKKLNYPGHLSQLRRTKSGPFTIEQAVSLDELNKFSKDNLKQKLLDYCGNASN